MRMIARLAPLLLPIIGGLIFMALVPDADAKPPTAMAYPRLPRRRRRFRPVAHFGLTKTPISTSSPTSPYKPTPAPTLVSVCAVLTALASADQSASS